MLRKSSWQLSLFDTYDRQGNDAGKERQDTIRVQELLVAEYETDGSRNLLLAKICELWYRDKSKERYAWEIEFDEALQADAFG